MLGQVNELDFWRENREHIEQMERLKEAKKKERQRDAQIRKGKGCQNRKTGGPCGRFAGCLSIVTRFDLFYLLPAAIDDRTILVKHQIQIS